MRKHETLGQFAPTVHRMLSELVGYDYYSIITPAIMGDEPDPIWIDLPPDALVTCKPQGWITAARHSLAEMPQEVRDIHRKRFRTALILFTMPFYKGFLPKLLDRINLTAADNDSGDMDLDEDFRLAIEQLMVSS